MTTASTASPELPDLDKLETLARAATPGRWMRLFGERTVYDRMEDGCRGNAIVRADLGYGPQDISNLDFIAGANPAAVLALIAIARRAQPEGEAPQAETLTPLDYRAQGREEALAIILGQSAEDPFSEYTGWSKSGAPDDEGGAHWKQDELRALLNIGDCKHDAYDRAEAAYWESMGQADEAKRELLLVRQAPFYHPLHDFLAKHEAWDLMGDLKRAQPAATLSPLCGAQHAESDESDGLTIGEAFKAVGGWMNGGELGYPSFGSMDALRVYTQKMVRSALAVQQAAAPGALLEILRDVHDTLESQADSDIDHFEDDEEERESAPMQYAARRVMQAIQLIQRAAQLDGGQEGSESNG